MFVYLNIGMSSQPHLRGLPVVTPTSRPVLYKYSPISWNEGVHATVTDSIILEFYFNLPALYFFYFAATARTSLSTTTGKVGFN